MANDEISQDIQRSSFNIHHSTLTVLRKTVVLNVVGLTPSMLGPSMPALAQWASQGAAARIKSAFPAVTCSAQADYLTGCYPDAHGIVGNGWYSREDAEIRFWKQSNQLVRAPKVWETARAADPSFTCANLFWWFNMYSTADYSVTPRPMYPADGRKVPDVYTAPGGLRDDLQAALGTFPLFEFWGPRAGIRSSEWIAAAAKHVDRRFNPTLTLVYLPHLDYNLQRVGPGPAASGDLGQIDAVAADLIRYYERAGARVIVVSEYGIRAVSTPVHLNRVLRQHGLIAVREELGHEMLDPGASGAFAVADHQVAHIYVNDPARLTQVREIIQGTPGVETVLGEAEKAAAHVAHERAGDLIAIAQPDAWFTYYFWMDDRRAPDFARTVEIHRKPGYDPVELFLDPAIRVPPLTVGWKLAKRKAGFRSLLDVISLDASLVKGSHGRQTMWAEDGPVLITQEKELLDGDRLTSVDVHGAILRHLGLR
jgi:predicted AlkP superfamily pyrophosphatase or phosphodiesterase